MDPTTKGNIYAQCCEVRERASGTSTNHNAIIAKNRTMMIVDDDIKHKPATFGIALVCLQSRLFLVNALRNYDRINSNYFPNNYLVFLYFY